MYFPFTSVYLLLSANTTVNDFWHQCPLLGLYKMSGRLHNGKNLYLKHFDYGKQYLYYHRGEGDGSGFWCASEVMSSWVDTGCSGLRSLANNTSGGDDMPPQSGWQFHDGRGGSWRPVEGISLSPTHNDIPSKATLNSLLLHSRSLNFYFLCSPKPDKFGTRKCLYPGQIESKI